MNLFLFKRAKSQPAQQLTDQHKVSKLSSRVEERAARRFRRSAVNGLLILVNEAFRLVGHN